MSAPIPYAKVGGPPDDWFGLIIFDLKRGREVADVVEVNAGEGWLIRLRRNKRGDFFIRNNRAARERMRGRFEIRRPSEGAS